MGDVDAYRVVTGTMTRSRFRVMCSARCIGRVRLGLEIGSGCDARVMAKLRFSVTVRWG